MRESSYMDQQKQDLREYLEVGENSFSEQMQQIKLKMMKIDETLALLKQK